MIPLCHSEQHHCGASTGKINRNRQRSEDCGYHLCPNLSDCLLPENAQPASEKNLSNVFLRKTEEGPFVILERNEIVREKNEMKKRGVSLVLGKQSAEIHYHT